MVKHITELNMKRKIKYFDKYRVKMKITSTIKSEKLYFNLFHIYQIIYLYVKALFGTEEMKK